MHDPTLSRRRALALLGAAAAVSCAATPAPAIPPPEGPDMPEPSTSPVPPKLPAGRMPAVYLPHGGGPWPFIDLSRFGPANMYDGMTAYLKTLRMVPPTTPRALLVISAHWEEPVPTVMGSKKPPMFYDYYGFPPEAYQVTWPAPGEPEVAAEVRAHLERAGFRTAVNGERGFDHGTFVPLKVAWPEADIPTFQLSLVRGLDPATHIRLGRALAPLRDAGVFVIGSGMSYHNMQGFFGGVRTAGEDSRVFDDWLAETVALDASARETRLVEWARAPRARACHPREEHLLPLMVVAGAALDDPGTTPYRGVLMGTHISAAHFAGTAEPSPATPTSRPGELG